MILGKNGNLPSLVYSHRDRGWSALWSTLRKRYRPNWVPIKNKLAYRKQTPDNL